MKIFGKRLEEPFLKRGGSLSLSIEAIVVLILAIAMLGLGLGFTKSMFAKIKGSIEVPEPENPATSDQPLVFNKDTITGKADVSLGFSVNVFNPTKSSPSMYVEIPASGCAGAMASSGITSKKSSSQTVPAGQYRTFKIVLDGANIKEGVTVCTVQAVGTGISGISRQITFDISG